VIGPSAYAAPLRGRGNIIRGWALVDVEDWRLVAGYRWSLAGKGYAARYPAHGSTVYLHREVLGLLPGHPLQGDHINGDKLDNRRSNLRPATPSLNRQNGHKWPGGTSTHRGVSWDRSRGLWRAQVGVERRYVYVEWFDDELEAARAVADARRRLQPGSPEAREAA